MPVVGWHTEACWPPPAGSFGVPPPPPGGPLHLRGSRLSCRADGASLVLPLWRSWCHPRRVSVGRSLRSSPGSAPLRSVAVSATLDPRPRSVKGCDRDPQGCPPTFFVFPRVRRVVHGMTTAAPTAQTRSWGGTGRAATSPRSDHIVSSASAEPTCGAQSDESDPVSGASALSAVSPLSVWSSCASG